MAVIRPADDKLLQCRADERRDGHDICGHLGRPISLLVPRQQVPGEGESQDEQQQKEAKPVIHFARGFVSAVDHHLHEMEHQQHVHGLGGEVVQPAQQPAACHLVLDVIDAFPGGL